jgi:hypothetical protein
MLKEMSKEKRLQWIRDFLKRSFDYREQLIPEWQDNKLGYMNYHEERDDWRSDMRFAYEYSQVETAKSAIVQAVMAPNPVVAWDPLGLEFTERVDTVEATMEHLMHLAGLEQVLEDAVHSGCLYGPMIVKVGWKDEEVSVPKFTQIGMGEGQVSVPDGEEFVKMPIPALSAVKVWDYFPDPYGDDEDSQHAVGERVWVTPQHLERKAERGVYNKAAVKEIIDLWRASGDAAHTSAGGDAGEDVDQTLDRSKMAGEAVENQTVQRIPILEVWTDEEVCTVVDRSSFDFIELRCERNRMPHGKKPYVIEHYVRIKNDPCGLGMVKFTREVSDAIASFHNQANDSRRLLIDARYVARDGVPLLEEELTGGPGSVVYVPNPSQDVQPLPQAGNLDLAGAEEASLLQWGDRVGAQSDFTRGVMMPGTGATATEAQEVSNRANARTALIVRRVLRLVKRMYGKALSLAQVFLDRPTAVRLLGDKGYQWKPVSAEELAGLYSARPRGALDNAEAQDRERWLTAAQFAQQNPYVNQFQFLKHLFMKLGVTDTHELLIDPNGQREIPQPYENELLLDGVQVPVQATDDHEAHLMALRAIRQAAFMPDGSIDPRMQDPLAMDAIRRHELEHLSYLAQAQQAAAAGPVQASATYDGAEAQGPAGFAARHAAQGTQGGQALTGPPGPGPANRG